jgi:hypothetical protein
MQQGVNEVIKGTRSRRLNLALFFAAMAFLAAVAWEHYRSAYQSESENVTLHPFGKGPQRPESGPQPAYTASVPAQATSAPGARAQVAPTAPAADTDGPAPPMAANGAFRLQEASALMLAIGPNMMSGQRAQQSLMLLLELSPQLARMPRKQRLDLDVLAQLHTRPERSDRMVELLHANVGAEQVQRSRKFFSDPAVHQFLVRLDESTRLKYQEVQSLAGQVSVMSDWRQTALWEIAKATHVWEVEEHIANVVGPAIMQNMGLPELSREKRRGLARNISVARMAHATAVLDDSRLWDLAQRLTRPEVATPMEWAGQAFMAELPYVVQGFRERFRPPGG